MWSSLRAVSTFLCLLVQDQAVMSVQGELVRVVTLTRHGSRAPNPVTDELCPANEENRGRFNVPPAQLTEYGMQQANKLGTFIRKTYVDTIGFLPPSMGRGSDDTFNAYFASDAADRCLQTAQATAQGLYPNGTGPPAYPNQPIPVQTIPAEFDNIFAAAHAGCKQQQEEDNDQYDHTRGAAVIANATNTTDVVAEACGVSIKDYAEARDGKEGLVLGVKDVNDMLNFDHQQGLESLPGITAHVRKEMNQLAFTLLQERYYSTARQITYWSGDMPLTLMEDLQEATKLHAAGEKTGYLYKGYHGHRELLYGVAHMLGWHFDVPGMPHALGTSAIPPTTTMFFELHYHDEQRDGEEDRGEGYYYVRTFTWTPERGQQEVALDACQQSAPGIGCPLVMLQGAVEEHVMRSDSWESICHHVSWARAEEMAQRAVYDEPQQRSELHHDSRPEPLSMFRGLKAIALVAVAGISIWLGYLAVKNKWKSARQRQQDRAYEVVP